MPLQELNAEVFLTLRPVRLAESPLTGSLNAVGKKN